MNPLTPLFIELSLFSGYPQNSSLSSVTVTPVPENDTLFWPPHTVLQANTPTHKLIKKKVKTKKKSLKGNLWNQSV